MGIDRGKEEWVGRICIVDEIHSASMDSVIGTYKSSASETRTTRPDSFGER